MFIIPMVSVEFDEATVKPTYSVFMFPCTMLVFIIAPAIALFYGGILGK